MHIHHVRFHNVPNFGMRLYGICCVDPSSQTSLGLSLSLALRCVFRHPTIWFLRNPNTQNARARSSTDRFRPVTFWLGVNLYRTICAYVRTKYQNGVPMVLILPERENRATIVVKMHYAKSPEQWTVKIYKTFCQGANEQWNAHKNI